MRPREHEPHGYVLSPAELVGELLTAAELLRLGRDQAGLDRYDRLTGPVGASLRHLTPDRQGQVLSLLQSAALCKARGDLIGLADVLEHQIRPLLVD
jgi:hypothetical protein